MSGMTEFDVAGRKILEGIEPLPTVEVDILESLGMTLAENVPSPNDIPFAANSAMDGFAVIHKDIEDVSEDNPVTLKVIDDIKAGDVSSRKVTPGTAIRIMTGAPLPRGADTVVMVEKTRSDGDSVIIAAPEDAGQNVRRASEDVRKGEVILEQGEIIEPAGMGMLASIGRSRVRVSRRPRVAILATGNELIEPDGQIATGKVRNTNTYSLFGQVLRCGAGPVALGIARDSREDTEKKVKVGLAHDVLLTSGGVSVGDYDMVRDVLTEMGLKLVFWKVRIKPGMPLLYGRIGNTPVFGLPGNPVSSMVTFELFVRPAILKMMGRNKLFRPVVTVTLDEDIDLRTGRNHFLRAVVTRADGGGYTARTTGPQGSGILTSMVLANALLMVGPDVSRVERGTGLKAMLTGKESM
ncbi:MAG: molybdopterin molybdotransferase MoeA [Candidatus Tritonobacter lacicola]|nr:molybdopterin molybdotransferase MoeA [Candidatus Tritonobacter lacicola]